MSLRIQKTILVLALVLLGSLTWAQAGNVEPDPATVQKYQAIFVQVMRDFFRLAEGVEDRSSPVVRSAALVNRKFQDGELSLSLDWHNQGLLYGGASFLVPNRPGRKPALSIGTKLLDLSETHPSVVLCVVAHELRHAADYFQQREHFVSGLVNHLTRLLFEADALAFELLFLETALEPRGYPLSRFERHLLEAHRRRDLARVMRDFERVDLGVIQELSELRTRFMSRNLEASQLERQVSDLLTHALDTVRRNVETAPDTERYDGLCTLFTAANLGAELLGGVAAATKNRQLTREEVIALYPRFFALYEEGIRLLEQNGAFWEGYQRRLLDGFEAEFTLAAEP